MIISSNFPWAGRGSVGGEAVLLWAGQMHRDRRAGGPAGLLLPVERLQQEVWRGQTVEAGGLLRAGVSHQPPGGAGLQHPAMWRQLELLVSLVRLPRRLQEERQELPDRDRGQRCVQRGPASTSGDPLLPLGFSVRWGGCHASQGRQQHQLHSGWMRAGLHTRRSSGGRPRLLLPQDKEEWWPQSSALYQCQKPEPLRVSPHAGSQQTQAAGKQPLRIQQ